MRCSRCGASPRWRFRSGSVGFSGAAWGCVHDAVVGRWRPCVHVAARDVERELGGACSGAGRSRPPTGAPTSPPWRCPWVSRGTTVITPSPLGPPRPARRPVGHLGAPDPPGSSVPAWAHDVHWPNQQVIKRPGLRHPSRHPGATRRVDTARGSTSSARRTISSTTCALRSRACARRAEEQLEPGVRDQTRRARRRGWRPPLDRRIRRARGRGPGPSRRRRGRCRAGGRARVDAQPGCRSRWRGRPRCDSGRAGLRSWRVLGAMPWSGWRLTLSTNVQSSAATRARVSHRSVGPRAGAVDQHERRHPGVDDFRAVDRRPRATAPPREWPTATASSRSSASNTDTRRRRRDRGSRTPPALGWRRPNPAGRRRRPVGRSCGDRPSERTFAAWRRRRAGARPADPIRIPRRATRLRPAMLTAIWRSDGSGSPAAVGVRRRGECPADEALERYGERRCRSATTSGPINDLVCMASLRARLARRP